MRLFKESFESQNENESSLGKLRVENENESSEGKNEIEIENETPNFQEWGSD